MVRPSISAAIERRVRTAAQSRCGYCLSPQHLVMARLEIEHIIPLAKGGSNAEANLWVAFPICHRRLGELGVLRMNELDVKTAVATAVTYLKDLYSDEQLKNLRLEEVWLSDDEKYWYITIGYDSPTSVRDPLAILRPPEREYKVLKVRVEDGRVVEMKIRQP